MNGSNRSEASRDESGPPLSLPGQARHSDVGMSAVGADAPAAGASYTRSQFSST